MACHVAFLLIEFDEFQVKDASIDQYSSKLVALDRECKRLQTETETLHGQAAKLREFERENKELQQSAVVEHKTLNAIRYVVIELESRLVFLMQTSNRNFILLIGKSLFKKRSAVSSFSASLMPKLAL